MKIYRAATNGYTGEGSFWAEDISIAKKYLDYNNGKGEREIISLNVDLSDVLDLTGRSDDAEVIAEICGCEAKEFAYEMLDEKSIRNGLASNGYKWVKFTDMDADGKEHDSICKLF